MALLIHSVFSDSNKLTLFITKVFGYRPGNNSSAFNVSTHEGAGTFQALANKELTSPKAYKALYYIKYQTLANFAI
ncbi:hypothetical protein H8356DRAFT_1359023 [Neocallimastix lanati (nom. inval.)]|nr:hypothetical protein H8356DRAFT_1359023 [Neocallimastix sp. JGI-2020a]